jgi:hypothetical protein
MTFSQPSADDELTGRARKISPALVDILDNLCTSCPKGLRTEKCPFGKLGGLSSASRTSLFRELEMNQALRLFDLASDCSCPKDPRNEAEATQ